MTLRPAATCPAHGKFLYRSRRAAKRAVRLMAQQRMREYRCEITPGCWHVGHFPQGVALGLVTAPEIYGHHTPITDLT